MKKFLKNYTSDVPVSVTVGRIENLLIRCGMLAITKEYGPDGGILALRFHMQIGSLPEMAVRLPVDAAAATKALWLDYIGDDLLENDEVKYSSRKRLRQKDFAEQGLKTAWKIAQDWLEVELSRMQLNQGDPREVFMAYIWDGRQTFFQRIEQTGFRALLPEKTEAA